METEFLTAADVHALTGYARVNEQESWLKHHGLPHRRDGRRVIVTRTHVRAWLEGKVVTPSCEPNIAALYA